MIENKHVTIAHNGEPIPKTINLGIQNENVDAYIYFYFADKNLKDHKKYLLATNGEYSEVFPILDDRLKVSTALTSIAGRWTLQVAFCENEVNFLTTNDVLNERHISLSNEFLGFVIASKYPVSNASKPMDANLQVWYENIENEVNELKNNYVYDSEQVKDELDSKITSPYVNTNGRTTLTDCDEGRIKNLVAKGKTTQFQRESGINLFDDKRIETTKIEGLNIINNDDGSITFRGIAPTNSNGRAYTIIGYELTQAEKERVFKPSQYGFCICNPTTNVYIDSIYSEPIALRVYLYDGDNPLMYASTWGADGSNFVLTQEIIDDETKVIKFEFAISGNASVIDMTYKYIFYDVNYYGLGVCWEPYKIPTPDLGSPQEMKAAQTLEIELSNDEKSNKFTYDLPFKMQSSLDGKHYDYIDMSKKKFVQVMKEVTLDGSEEWSFSASVSWMRDTKINDALTDLTTSIVCDSLLTYAVADPSDILQYEYGKICLRYGYLCYREDNLSIEDWKAMLQANPITVLYPLVTPIEHDLPQELIDKLSELSTCNGVTNIVSNVPVKFDYMQNFNSFIDDKLEPLENKIQEVKTDIQEVEDSVIVKNGYHYEVLMKDATFEYESVYGYRTYGVINGYHLLTPALVESQVEYEKVFVILLNNGVRTYEILGWHRGQFLRYDDEAAGLEDFSIYQQNFGLHCEIEIPTYIYEERTQDVKVTILLKQQEGKVLIKEDGMPLTNPLVLDSTIDYTLLPFKGDEALQAIIDGRQILVKVPNADGSNFTTNFMPVIQYQLPKVNNNYLYLIYFKDGLANNIASVIGALMQGQQASFDNVYGQLKMELSTTYTECPLK